jgi:hypothetical protein
VGETGSGACTVAGVFISSVESQISLLSMNFTFVHTECL